MLTGQEARKAQQTHSQGQRLAQRKPQWCGWGKHLLQLVQPGPAQGKCGRLEHWQLEGTVAAAQARPELAAVGVR